jgi:hypothetical protein
MSRGEKLYQRLDALERDYREVASAELARVLEAGYSSPLAYKAWGWNPRRWKWGQRLDRLEKEIGAIREKLDEPMRNSPVSAIRRVCEKLNEVGAGRWNEVRPLIRHVLAEWGRTVPAD